MSFEVDKVDDLALAILQVMYQFSKAQVVETRCFDARFREMYEGVQRLVLMILFMLSGTQMVDGCMTGDIQHPGKKASFRGIVAINISPNFQKYILKDFFGGFIGFHHAPNNSIKRIAILIVQLC